MWTTGPEVCRSIRRGCCRTYDSPTQTEPFRAEDDRAVAAASKRHERARTPADPLELRGLPCLAPGVNGVQPGSDPLGLLLAKEHGDAAELNSRVLSHSGSGLVSSDAVDVES